MQRATRTRRTIIENTETKKSRELKKYHTKDRKKTEKRNKKEISIIIMERLIQLKITLVMLANRERRKMMMKVLHKIKKKKMRNLISCLRKTKLAQSKINIRKLMLLILIHKCLLHVMNKRKKIKKTRKQKTIKK